MKKLQLILLDASLLAPAAEFCAEHQIQLCDKAELRVSATVGEVLSVKRTSDGAAITYRARNELFRALTMLSDVLQGGADVVEASAYRLLSYMGDCSRNAVYNMPTAKLMVRRLAGMGYNSMMLYIEDTYELPEYKYFGLMRGRFTEEELKELDAYAASYGLELIPCIQTLAHLTTALRWPDFNGYRDSGDILMVGDERTYRFLEAAIRQCRKCFRTNSINIGMDEAHLVACGEYLKRNGYRKPSDVMLEHLDRVVKICHEAGLRPMMWGDMFFRMAFDGAYYIDEGKLPEDVVAKVPEGLDMVYWDYYTMNSKRFAHMLDCHTQFKNDIIFAGGAWKWSGFGGHNAFSLKSTEMQLRLCAERNIDRIIVTAWGDNGGEASQFSVLPSMLYFAERGYLAKHPDAEWLNNRALQCFGTTWENLMAFDLTNALPESTVELLDHPATPAKYLLFNDPFERLLDCHMNRENVADEYAKRAEILLSKANDPCVGYALESLGLLCRVLANKSDLGWKLHEAYLADNKAELSRLANETVPQIICDLKAFLESFRRQWYRENRPNGFIAQEIRIGGLLTRMESVKQRLNAYVSGEIEEIPELKDAPLPIIPNSDGKYINFNRWSQTVSAGVL